MTASSCSWYAYRARPGIKHKARREDEDPYHEYAKAATFFSSHHGQGVLHMLDMLPLNTVAQAFTKVCKTTGSSAAVFKALKGLRACSKEGMQFTHNIVTELLVQLERSGSSLHKQAALVKALPYLQDLTIHQPERDRLLEFLEVLHETTEALRLRCLRLQDCSYTDNNLLASVSATFPYLEVLVLDACCITSAEGEQLFASLSACSKLHTLVVAAVGLPSSALKSLESISSLRTLVLAQPESETAGQEHGMQAFTLNTADLSGLTQLESLDIHCGLSPASCAPISALTNMKTLGIQLMGEAGGVCWSSDILPGDMAAMLQDMNKLEAFRCDVHLADEALEALVGKKNLKVVDVMSVDARELEKGAFPALQEVALINWPMETRTVVNLLRACPNLAKLRLKPSPYDNELQTDYLELSGYITNPDDVSEIARDLVFLETELPRLGLEVGILKLQTWAHQVEAAEVLKALPVTSLPKALHINGINTWDAPSIKELARCFPSIQDLRFKHAYNFTPDSILSLTSLPSLLELHLPSSCLGPSKILQLALSALVVMHPTLDTIELFHGVACVTAQGGDSEAKLCVLRAVQGVCGAQGSIFGHDSRVQDDASSWDVGFAQDQVNLDMDTGVANAVQGAEIGVQADSGNVQEVTGNVSEAAVYVQETAKDTLGVPMHVSSSSNSQGPRQGNKARPGHVVGASAVDSIGDSRANGAQGAQAAGSGRVNRRKGKGRGRHWGKQSSNASDVSTPVKERHVAQQNAHGRGKSQSVAASRVGLGAALAPLETPLGLPLAVPLFQPEDMLIQSNHMIGAVHSEIAGSDRQGGNGRHKRRNNRRKGKALQQQ